MHLRDRAEIDGVQLHPAEVQLVEAPGDIGQIAAEAVDRFGHHHLEGSRLGIAHQVLKARAGQHAGAGDSRIFVASRQHPALPLNIAPADLDLIRNRRRTLLVRRVPGVNYRTHDWCLPFVESHATGNLFMVVITISPELALDQAIP
nr:hypothetical protein [Acidocella aromatica]